MLEPIFTSQFYKDFKKVKKQGKNTRILKQIIDSIVSERKLDAKFKDHKLIGNYLGCRECHVDPDLLLIYQVATGDFVKFMRPGSHATLFKK